MIMPMPIKNHYEFVCFLPRFINLSSDIETPNSKIWSASFRLDQYVSHLFPYINAILDDALYYEKPEHIRFLFNGYRCFLYTDSAVVHFFESKTAARDFIPGFIEFLNSVEAQKNNTRPNYDQIKPVPIIDILKILPKTNCKKCGYLTCMAFAAAVMKGKEGIDNCPDLASPVAEKAEYPVFDDTGALVKSVSLPINTSKLKTQIQTQQEHILMLEAALREGEQKKDGSADNSNQPEKNWFGLTVREIEVLKGIAEGYTNNEISGILFISPHTVKSHMINIFNKLSVNDRTQAAVLATRHHII